MQLRKFTPALTLAACTLGLLGGSAHAGLIGTTVGVHVYSSYQDDGGVHSADFFNGNVVVGAGSEVSHSFSIQETQGGFSTPTNVFSGTVGVDISDSGIFVSYTGQAQPASIMFDFTGLSDIAALAITNVGGMSGVNYFLDPVSSTTDITGMGFGLLGFQPGTEMGQTAAITFRQSNGGGGTAPEPASLALAGLALVAGAATRRRKQPA